jgi:RimJ/RimL family protein N-acetyltransferase
MKKILETERLILREYTMEDFEGLYAILSDPVTMSHYPRPYDEKGTLRWLNWSLDNYAKYGFGLWAIELKETGRFIGDCGITMQNIDGETLPEIGYHIHRDYWRQGYGKEAARAVRDWFFTHTDFDAVYSYMTAGNTASYSTAASAGMKRVKEYDDPREGRHYVYAMTRGEWQELTGRCEEA